MSGESKMKKLLKWRDAWCDQYVIRRGIVYKIWSRILKIQHQGYSIPTSANFSVIQFFNWSLRYSVDGILPRICIYSSGYFKHDAPVHLYVIFSLINASVIVTIEVYSRCWHISNCNFFVLKHDVRHLRPMNIYLVD